MVPNYKNRQNHQKENTTNKVKVNLEFMEEKVMAVAPFEMPSPPPPPPPPTPHIPPHPLQPPPPPVDRSCKTLKSVARVHKLTLTLKPKF